MNDPIFLVWERTKCKESLSAFAGRHGLRCSRSCRANAWGRKKTACGAVCVGEHADPLALACTYWMVVDLMCTDKVV